MMNLAAICLVISALIGAEIWSPVSNQPVLTQNQSPAGDDVVVKDGHRVVVVEYDQDGTPNTKITISPTTTEHKEDAGFFDKAKEKIADVLPNVGQGFSQPEVVSDEEEPRRATAGELICDALGRCKHRIAGAIGKTKDTVQELGDRVGESAAGLKHRSEEAVQDVKDDSVHMVHEAEESAAHRAHIVKEAAAEKAQQMKEGIHLTEEVAAHTAQNVSDSLKAGLHKLIKATGPLVATTAKVMPSPSTLGRVVGMLGFSTAFGTCMWVTFVSSYVLAEVQPRQQLGVVQSKIYPVYFRVVGWSIGVALLGHLLGQGKKLLRFPAADLVQSFNLLFGLLMVVVNAVFFEPRATKVMFERMKIEKEEGRGRPMFAADSAVDGGKQTTPVRTGTSESMDHEWAVRARMAKLSERLKKLNSYSSWLNIMSLMSLTWYLVYVAQRLC